MTHAATLAEGESLTTLELKINFGVRAASTCLALRGDEARGR